MINIIANLYPLRLLATQNLYQAIQSTTNNPTYLFDFSNPASIDPSVFDSCSRTVYNLWSTDPSSINLIRHFPAHPHEHHLFIFNGLKDVFQTLRSFYHLCYDPSTVLTIYTFDTLPKLIMDLNPRIKFKTISYPFFPLNFKITLPPRPTLTFAGELNYSYSTSIPELINKLTSFLPNSEYLSTFLSHDRLASYNYNIHRCELYQHISTSDVEIFSSYEQLYSTLISDIFRLRLVRNLSRILSPTQYFLQGDHILHFGLSAKPSNRNITSDLHGTLSLDPGSHTISNILYYRPCDLLSRGALPVPIGYQYPHITASHPLPYLSDFNPSSFTQLTDHIATLNGKCIDVSVNGTFSF